MPCKSLAEASWRIDEEWMTSIKFRQLKLPELSVQIISNIKQDNMQFWHASKVRDGGPKIYFTNTHVTPGTLAVSWWHERDHTNWFYMSHMETIPTPAIAPSKVSHTVKRALNTAQLFFLYLHRGHHHPPYLKAHNFTQARRGWVEAAAAAAHTHMNVWPRREKAPVNRNSGHMQVIAERAKRAHTRAHTHTHTHGGARFSSRRGDLLCNGGATRNVVSNTLYRGRCVPQTLALKCFSPNFAKTLDLKAHTWKVNKT